MSQLSGGDRQEKRKTAMNNFKKKGKIPEQMELIEGRISVRRGAGRSSSETASQKMF